jgi:hypothetical protein
LACKTSIFIDLIATFNRARKTLATLRAGQFAVAFLQLRSTCLKLAVFIFFSQADFESALPAAGGSLFSASPTDPPAYRPSSRDAIQLN